ncbi:MAG: invasion associated locus B family protein [Brucellaceae bacterium]|nr:invasion associated locus B family protein [Brucellaceae bacterium]
MKIHPFRATVSALAAALLLSAPLPSAAQQNGTVRSTHGAWSIICDTPPGSSSEQCAMMQNVIAEDRPEVGLSVVVLRTADNKAEILRVLAPLGVLLPNGLGLNVDGQDIGRAYFVRCFQDGCYGGHSRAAIAGNAQEGRSGDLYRVSDARRGNRHPVDLSGFGEGFDALP